MVFEPFAIFSNVILLSEAYEVYSFPSLSSALTKSIPSGRVSATFTVPARSPLFVTVIVNVTCLSVSSV